MKSLVKFLTLSLTAITVLGTFAFGQMTVVARPAEVPAGAYVNGADGDHYFFQTIEFTTDGTPALATNYRITLPAGITVADVDGNLTYDEFYINGESTGAAATWSIAAPGASTVDILNGGIGGFVAGDRIAVTFPVETSVTPAAGLTYTVAATNDLTSTAGTSNTVDIVSVVTIADTYFDDIYLNDAGVGKIQTNVRGTRHPDDAGAGSLTYTDLMPNLLLELTDGGAGVETMVKGASDWLVGTAAFVVPVAENDGEVTLRLWASMTDGLSRIGDGTGELAEDAGTGAAFAAVNEAAAITSGAIGTVDALNTINLAEGNWFFYITSDATSDWVLGSSDTLEVRHQPAFVDRLTGGPAFTNLVATGVLIGAGDGIDYDQDDIFEAITDDDVTAMTLESGGIIGRDNTLAGGGNEATDSVNVYWFIEDVDDNARIHVFHSTSSAWLVTDVTTAGGVVTGLGTATEITTSAVYEEDPDNFATWDIYTDAATFDAAADYFLYIVAYDGKNVLFKKVTESTGATSLTVTAKHFPFLKFHDMRAADDLIFDTALDRYLPISWGETIDGDKDADAAGTAVIKLYIVDEGAGGAANLYANIVAAADPTSPTSLLNLQTNGTLIGTITHTSDTQ